MLTFVRNGTVCWPTVARPTRILSSLSSASGTEVLIRASFLHPQITIEQLKTELAAIHEFVLLYPPLGDKGPPRTATVQGKHTFTQLLLAQELGLRTPTPPRARKSRVGKTQNRS